MRRYGRGMRFSCWLVAWCVLMTALCVRAQTAKEEPRVGWSLVLEGRTFRSAKEVGFYFGDPKAGSGKESVREVELELRQGDVRMARWPYSYELMLPKEVKDERKGKRQGYARGLPEDLLQWMAGRRWAQRVFASRRVGITRVWRGLCWRRGHG